MISFVEWVTAFAFTVVFFAILFGVVRWVENTPQEEECALVASIKTDTRKHIGGAHYRNLYLKQYKCGDKTKTVVE